MHWSAKGCGELNKTPVGTHCNEMCNSNNVLVRNITNSEDERGRNQYKNSDNFTKTNFAHFLFQR